MPFSSKKPELSARIGAKLMYGCTADGNIIPILVDEDGAVITTPKET